MRIAFACLAAVTFTVPAFAQFSNDASSNLVLADSGGEQVQPKVRVAADGAIWYSWFDNANGGYKPTVMCVNPRGFQLLPHNGVTLANTTNGSTVDYGLTTDAQGNALITFMDNSLGGSQVVTVHKISQDGVKLWGPNGVQMIGSTGAANPKVASLSNGDVMVGWSVGGSFTLQRLASANGAIIGLPIPTIEVGHALTLSDLQPGDNGSVIALWIRGFTTNFLSSKWLYAQKWDTTGTAVWPVTPGLTAVGVYAPQPNVAPYGAQGGSVQNGYFPTMPPDGFGGVVVGWYETAGTRNAYVQHVRSNGEFRLPANGQPTGSANIPGANIAIAGTAAYLAATDEIVLGWIETNAGSQSTNAIYAQKIAADNSVQWGGGAVVRTTADTSQPSFLKALPAGSGAFLTWINSAGGTDQNIRVQKLDAGGNAQFDENGDTVCSAGGAKSRLDAALLPNGAIVTTFGTGASGSVDILTQPESLSRRLGPGACTDADVAALGGALYSDELLTADDVVGYLGAFFAGDLLHSDLAQLGGARGPDGQLTPDDLVYFLSQFFAGCGF